MQNNGKTMIIRLDSEKDKDIIEAVDRSDNITQFVKSALKNKIEKNSEFEKNFIKFYRISDIRINIGKNIISLDPANEDKFLFFENEKLFFDFCIFNEKIATKVLCLTGDDLSIVYEINISGASNTLKLGSCTLLIYKIDNLFAFVKMV